MPLKPIRTTAATMAVRVRAKRCVNSRTSSATPPHVQSGTAQFNAAGPNQRPTSPGTM